jgi:hypothetical protein
MYEVWGTSDDPSSWFCQITLLSRAMLTIQRKLKRYEVPKQIQMIVEEDKRPKELNKL